MVPGQTEIAKVNRKTGTLYLSSDIWDRLPNAEKNFVIYHEEGHLKLETADEFAANKYAIGKYLSAGQFTSKELGKKIMVMKSIFDKAEDSQTSNFAIAEAVAGAVGSITQSLPVLGIGSKSRIKETQATAAANASVYAAQANAASATSKAQAKTTTTILIVAGVMLIIGIVVYFTLRGK